MIHLTNKAREVVTALRHGFKANPANPRERAIDMSPRFSDPEDDREMLTAPPDEGGEMTVEEFETRLRDYCNFEVYPDLSDAMPDENPYIDMSLVAADVEYGFNKAFDAYLRREFGDDVRIDRRESGDVEISRVAGAASV